MAATMHGIADDSPGARAAWTSRERESFFEAIARHRRAAWRVTLASAFADAVDGPGSCMRC
jgi:hypothetical protein